MDDRERWRSLFDADPVAHAREVRAGFNRKTELPRKLRQDLSALMSHKVGAPVDGHDPRQALPRLEPVAGMLREPIAKAQCTQVHFCHTERRAERQPWE